MSKLKEHDFQIKEFLKTTYVNKIVLKYVLEEDSQLLLNCILTTKRPNNEPINYAFLAKEIQIEESVIANKVKFDLNNAFREFSEKYNIKPPIQLYFRTNKSNVQDGYKLKGYSNIGAHLACSTNKNKHISGVFISLEDLENKLSNTLSIIHQDWPELRKAMYELENTSVYGEGTLKSLFIDPILKIDTPSKNNKSEIKPDSGITILSRYSSGEILSDNNNPILILGEFGSGKSSLLKMFASKYAYDRKVLFPVYIPLSEILIYSKDSLIVGLERYLSIKYHIKNFEEIISSNSIFWLFDGFDELNLYEYENELWIVDRYRELVQLAESNKVVISSRPIMFLGDLNNIILSTSRIKISLFSNPQIQDWISLWKKNPKYKNSLISSEGLDKRKLLDVARNPMILFMVGTMFDHELKEERPYLRSEIYQYFIDSTEKGKYKKDKDVECRRYTPSNYRKILQEIAFLIFRYSSSGFISKEQLQKYLPETEIVEEIINSRKLRTILVGHFFQEVTKSNKKYVEFSHKSFREYLVVEKFINMLIQSTEKKFDAYEWHKLCCKMLTTEKMDFLCECLCLLRSDVRKNIFNTFQKYLLPTGGIQKEFIPSTRNDSKQKTELIKSLHFTSTIRNILSYYVCSVIASYASNEFRNKLKYSLTKDFIACIFHECHSYTLGSTPIQAWELLLNELPGGIWGPNLDLHGFEINSKHFKDIAILLPKANNITINSEFISLIFCVLNNYNILNLGGKYIGQSIFYGGTIILSNNQSGFNKCTFLNCQIINTNKKNIINFENCNFVNTEMINISPPTQNPVNARQISKKIELAQKVLIEYTDEITCSCMVPWGDVVIEKIPDFENIVFGLKNEEHSMLSFSNICRNIAISSENI